MGKDVLSIRTAQHCFHRFKNGNFELDDLPHSGRPLQVDMDLLKELIEQDPRLTTRCLAERLGCSHIAIETHLHELGKTWKYGVWIPHQLSPLQLQQRVDACMELMTSHRNYQWLHNLVTGDEKWVLYINYGYHRQWLSPGKTGVVTPKPDLFTPRRWCWAYGGASEELFIGKFFLMVVPSLLISTVSCCSKTQREARSDLLFAWPC